MRCDMVVLPVTMHVATQLRHQTAFNHSNWCVEKPFYMSLKHRVCLMQGLSITCSTPQALSWDESWANTHEISGRAMKVR